MADQCGLLCKRLATVKNNTAYSLQALALPSTHLAIAYREKGVRRGAGAEKEEEEECYEYEYGLW
jgi:hypothetical protein